MSVFADWADFAASAVDILIVAWILYRVLLVIKDTRAFQMLIGLLIITLAYVVSPFLKLYTLNWILNKFLSPFIIIIFILFQDDIRRGLTRVGKSPFFGARGKASEAEALEAIARACVTMAGKRVGALIVFEREVRLAEYLESGVPLDARVAAELITSIFQPTSVIHDGAVIVSRDRIIGAGVILPLTKDPNVSRALGTRHRAAIGVTEATDALAVVVSEEEGSISLVAGGRIRRDLDGAALRRMLAEEFNAELPGVEGAAVAGVPAPPTSGERTP
ncbi:MAG TPA: diadenylate cyclase CdaA [bacterium]|nr:diadenylate cyclase CdaA [bacterium]